MCIKNKEVILKSLKAETEKQVSQVSLEKEVGNKVSDDDKKMRFLENEVQKMREFKYFDNNSSEKIILGKIKV